MVVTGSLFSTWRDRKKKIHRDRGREGREGAERKRDRAWWGLSRFRMESICGGFTPRWDVFTPIPVPRGLFTCPKPAVASCLFHAKIAGGLRFVGQKKTLRYPSETALRPKAVYSRELYSLFGFYKITSKLTHTFQYIIYVTKIYIL